MTNRLVSGMIAGAAGTLALNIATYADMLVRGRPPSKLSGQVAAQLAAEWGLPLDFELEEGERSEEKVAHRQEALGALLGYANGIGIGLGYGLLRLVIPRMPLWVTGAALGSAAMAAADVPATKMGLTNPQDWQPADWAADVVPHMVYGLVTAITFEALRD